VSFRIIKDGGDQKILDEQSGHVIAVVVAGYGVAGAKALVELANRQEAEAKEEARAKTVKLGGEE
jgi:hypothetical protein